MIGGIYTPSEGVVRLNGTVSGLFELGGFGNQFITGREYAERVLRFQGVAHRALPGLIAEIQKFAEIGEYFDRRLHTYSSGMGARLYFATAMALPREIFLIDEVLSVGDAHFQAKSWRLVRDRLAQGASGILVTHDWSAVIKLCRKAIILDKGRIIDQGPADLVVAKYLALPRPDGSIARFVELESGYLGESGADLTISLAIESRKNVDLEFAYSIELLRLGVGWEILMLSHFVPVGRGAGRRRIVLTIPQLPLAPGDYSLNVFLRTSSADDAIEADSRTWTTGTGLKLTVGGQPTRGASRLPVSWQIGSFANA